MSPFGPLEAKEEQTEEERLEVARRYRARRTRELRDLAAPHVDGEVVEAGEFSTLPLESLAAIPILGAFFAFVARARQSRKRMTPNVLVALTRDDAWVLAMHGEVEGPRLEPISSWPRSSIRVASVERKFMREQVMLEIDGGERLKLFASPLRTNPWAAAVVRELGGEAPEPLDLGAPGAAEGG